MYVCLCNAINERTVIDSVKRGARTLSDLQADTGVATVCGCCADTAKEYLPKSASLVEEVVVRSPLTGLSPSPAF